MNSNQLPKPTIDVELATSDIATFGYCIVKNVLSAEEVKALRVRLTEQVEAEAEIGLTHHLPDRKQLVMFLLNKGKVFRDILSKVELHAVVKSVLGAEYLLSAFHAHIAHPGGEKVFHTDQFWMPPPTTADKKTLIRPGSITRARNRGHHVGGEDVMNAPTISPAVVCNAMWMLDEFTAENGATIVVPGSHLSGRQPDAAMDDDANWVPAVAPAGSVVIFEGRTWHSTGVNRTTKTRIGLTTNFCAPQFRQQENLLLGTRPEVLESMSDELKKLCGFRQWQGYGAFENSGDFVKRDQYTVGELRPSSL
ncbi:MAG: phytanoyl-CoA dioxygenase family protein [Gammaproteobacteria bacterium]|nr:phytanoyl-CoA dioxygenase family protein [Gammaproteobacteria bacterium]